MLVPISLRFPILVGFMLLFHTTVVFAEETLPTIQVGGGAEMRFFSSKKIYPEYIANPQRLTLGIERVWVSHNDIPLSSSDRYMLRAGGEATLVDLYPRAEEHPLAEITVFGGFQGLVDLKYWNDTIAWDGKYGCALSFQAMDHFLFRTGMRHISSHLGDKNPVTSDLTDLAYSRDEIFAASSFNYENWRIYGEGGYGYRLFADVQKPLRVEGGVEYEARTPSVPGESDGTLQSTSPRGKRTIGN